MWIRHLNCILKTWEVLDIFDDPTYLLQLLQSKESNPRILSLYPRKPSAEKQKRFLICDFNILYLVIPQNPGQFWVLMLVLKKFNN